MEDVLTQISVECSTPKYAYLKKACQDSIGTLFILLDIYKLCRDILAINKKAANCILFSRLYVRYVV